MILGRKWLHGVGRCWDVQSRGFEGDSEASLGAGGGANDYSVYAAPQPLQAAPFLPCHIRLVLQR